MHTPYTIMYKADIIRSLHNAYNEIIHIPRDIHHCIVLNLILKVAKFRNAKTKRD